MGTRAQFFVGDPRDGGRLLGCIAFDAYPEGLPWLEHAGDERSFEEVVQIEAGKRQDWTPAAKGFPFPWTDDLFLTDYTYAYFGGALQVACYHSGFITLADILACQERREEDDPFADVRDALPSNFPAPVERSRQGEGRDSIIIISAAS